MFTNVYNAPVCNFKTYSVCLGSWLVNTTLQNPLIYNTTISFNIFIIFFLKIFIVNNINLLAQNCASLSKILPASKLKQHISGIVKICDPNSRKNQRRMDASLPLALRFSISLCKLEERAFPEQTKNHKTYFGQR